MRRSDCAKRWLMSGLFRPCCSVFGNPGAGDDELGFAHPADRPAHMIATTDTSLGKDIIGGSGPGLFPFQLMILKAGWFHFSFILIFLTIRSETGIESFQKRERGVFVRSPSLFFIQFQISVLIAGSCATKNHELRQVRKGATVMTLFVCHRVPGYHFFVQSSFCLFGVTANASA